MELDSCARLCIFKPCIGENIDAPTELHEHARDVVSDLKTLFLQPGLAILESEAKVMQCYDNILESQTYSEIGASAAILKANYSLDSFMTRYRKVEWLEKQNWGCNER